MGCINALKFDFHAEGVTNGYCEDEDYGYGYGDGSGDGDRDGCGLGLGKGDGASGIYCESYGNGYGSGCAKVFGGGKGYAEDEKSEISG